MRYFFFFLSLFFVGSNSQARLRENPPPQRVTPQQLEETLRYYTANSISYGNGGDLCDLQFSIEGEFIKISLSARMLHGSVYNYTWSNDTATVYVPWATVSQDGNSRRVGYSFSSRVNPTPSVRGSLFESFSVDRIDDLLYFSVTEGHYEYVTGYRSEERGTRDLGRVVAQNDRHTNCTRKLNQ